MGFHALPLGFFAALVGMVLAYLGLIEIGKRLFYGALPTRTTKPIRRPRRHLRRRMAYFSTPPRPAGRRRGTSDLAEVPRGS